MADIVGGYGYVLLAGTEGADFIWADLGDQTVLGRGGDDIILLTGGFDTVDGGDGTDILDPSLSNYVFNDLAFYDTGERYVVVGPQGRAYFSNVELIRKNGSEYIAVADLPFQTIAATLTGGDIGDFLFGGAASNTITGGGGNDYIDGGASEDTLYGGTGDDTYRIGLGDVVIEYAGEGTDTVLASQSEYTLTQAVENLTFVGSGAFLGIGNAGDNVITGGAAADTLIGGDGNDVLSGGGGADTMIGGAGDDHYWVADVASVTEEQADGGNDTVHMWADLYTLAQNFENLVYSGLGNFTATGNELGNSIASGSGADTLFGLAGNDTISAGGGEDMVDGGEGNDTIDGGSGADSLVGAAGNDTLFGQAGADILIGGAGDDMLAGGDDADSLDGGDGADSLDGGAGVDTLAGGMGDDTYGVDNASDVISEAAGEGTDTVRATASYTLGAELENLINVGGAGFVGTGNGLGNLITGGSGTDTLLGLAGDDTLVGGDGNNNLQGGDGVDILLDGNAASTLDGGSGADTMIGGGGGDIYYVDNVGDVVSEAASQGSDAIFVTLSTYSLPEHVESLWYSGSGNFTGYGNGGNNTLRGKNGADTLIGGGGHDVLIGAGGINTLIGGAGNDVYGVNSYGVSSADILVEEAGGGTDTVLTLETLYSLAGTHIENFR